MNRRFPSGVCPCHGEPVLESGRQRYCAVKRRLSNQAAARRYRASAKGAANVVKHRQRRIFIGHEYHSRAATAALAAQINAHIKERLFGSQS